jgi:hypothetical protein
MCELKAYLERGESIGLVRDKALLIEASTEVAGHCPDDVLR